MLLSLFISSLVFLSGHLVTGERILMAGVHVPSHLQHLQEVGQALAKRGHSVYLAIDEYFPNWEKFVKPGITAVTFHSTDAHFPRFWSEMAKHHLMSRILGKEAHGVVMTMRMGMQDCSNMMRDDVFLSKVTALKFDLLIYDGFFYCPCNVILASHLSISAVFVSCSFLGWDARVPINPAVTPLMIFDHSDRMTFLQRLVNVVFYLGSTVYKINEWNTTLLQKFAPGVTSWMELQQQATILYIITRDHLLEWPEPQMPNVIRIPGITTHPAGELPWQLNELMDAAIDGVIVVSFGGTVSGQFPTEVISKFFNAFSRLKQTVIFKMSGTDATMPSNRPRNVHLFPWLPQNDLLGHPNTVLFITHCGNNGQYESLYHGVPMIGFPLFAEQPHNAFRMVEHGYGIDMKILTFTADELVNNVHRVLDEKAFKMAVRNLDQ